MNQTITEIKQIVQQEIDIAKSIVSQNSSVVINQTDVFSPGPVSEPVNHMSNNEGSIQSLFEVVNTKMYQLVKPLLEEAKIQEETESKKVEIDKLHVDEITEKVKEELLGNKVAEVGYKHSSGEKAIDFARDKYNEVLAKYQGLKDEYTLNKNRVKRHIPLNKFKSSILYYALLIFIGICEVPLNKVIFQRFGESDNVTFIMAGTLAIAVPVLAHFIGLFWRQRSEMREYFWKAIIFTVAFLVTNFGLGLFRANVLNEIVARAGKEVTTQDLYLNIGIFVGITTILFIIGVIAAYLRHDPSFSLEHSYKEMVKAEKVKNEEWERFRKVEKEVEDNTLTFKTKAHERYDKALNKILDIPNKAIESYDRAKTNYKLVHETAIGLENQIQAEYAYIANSLQIPVGTITKNFQQSKF